MEAIYFAMGLIVGLLAGVFGMMSTKSELTVRNRNTIHLDDYSEDDAQMIRAFTGGIKRK